MRHPGQGELTYPQRGLTRLLALGQGSRDPAQDPVAQEDPVAQDPVAQHPVDAAEQRIRESRWPAGYTRVEKSITVGYGAAVYLRLAEAVLGWDIQLGAGLTLRGPERAVPGARVISGFGIGDLRLPVPCEVVWAQEPTAVESEDGRNFRPQLAGFGYGTLPGHPASGEEAFVVRLDEDGSVRFDVLAFSRPADLIFRLAAPVAAVSQRLVTRRYLQAARHIASALPRG
ncbi:DUF1990 family protein [Arthrobacter sp. A5]|uniref:DUF1990 family protein n=1 Tax=Arthrobacter sp. A5 TaxID=576926 RepID=UPI003DA90DD0